MPPRVLASGPKPCGGKNPAGAIKLHVYSFHRCSRLPALVCFLVQLFSHPSRPYACHKYVMPYSTSNYTLLLIQTYDS